MLTVFSGSVNALSGVGAGSLEGIGVGSLTDHSTEENTTAESVLVLPCISDPVNAAAPGSGIAARVRSDFQTAALSRASVTELSLTYKKGAHRVWGPSAKLSEEDEEKLEKLFSAMGDPGIVCLPGGALTVRHSSSDTSIPWGELEDGALVEITRTLTKDMGTPDPSDDQVWYRISSGDMIGGYVEGSSILTGEDAFGYAHCHFRNRCVITAEKANVRTAPNTGSDSRLYVARMNQSFTLAEDQDASGWYKVITPEGREAYISEDCAGTALCLPTGCAYRYRIDDSTRDALVSYALQFEGNPYVWYGESLTSGCDCSGYIMLLYRDITGMELPHFSASQAQRGREIGRSELKPGDLIFYDTMKAGRISHVALYIGDGRAVQALNERVGIVIKSIDFAQPLKYVNLLDYPNEASY